MKLTSRKHGTKYAGQTLTWPLLGDQTFSEDGTLEVDDEKADAFIEITKDSFDFAKPDDKKSKKDDPDDSDPDVAEWKEQLAAAKTEELLAMAKEANLAGGNAEKIAAMTDDKLRKELLKVLTKKK